MKLVKFGSVHCGPCRSMDKSKILERFVAKHPEINLEKIDTETEEGEELIGLYGVTSIPTIVFELDSGGELARDEGGQTMQSLEDLFSRAKVRLKIRARSPQREGVEPNREETA